MLCRKLLKLAAGKALPSGPASTKGIELFPGPAHVRFLTSSLRVAYDAFLAFGNDDGWAIASHIALSLLMSLFPFLIFVTALSGFLGTQDLADQVALLLLEAWPEEVAAPLSGEITRVLTTAHSGLLTIGAALALYFSSSGIESLRIGLNRAYGMAETRPWWLLRLESIGYVLVAALALIALSFLIVLGPLILHAATRYFPGLAELEGTLTFLRFGVATVVIVIALVLVHKWLPAGRRALLEVAPGIIVTLALWLVAGVLFGRYLAEFTSAYVSMYAGLATAMIALVFLYWTATIFIYGGELNAAIGKVRGRTDRLRIDAGI
jgi:membrane protein